MHPYVTELVAVERINSYHQEATAARRARAARRSPRLHTPRLGRPPLLRRHQPSRPAAA